MKRVWGFFSQKQSTIGSAAFVLMLMVLVSRLLGLVRDRLLSARFAPEELGVYFAAFRLPNLVFELLVMGALTSAFIPVFTKYLTQRKEDEGWRMASTLINLSIIVLVFMLIPMLIWTRELSALFAPGFSAAQIDDMTQFTRFMMVFQVVPLLIGNFLTGILQSYNLFFVPALAPVVYNIGIIVGIIFLSPMLGLQAPVVGIGIGAALFMLIQIPLVFMQGYRHKWALDVKDKGVREVAKMVGPRTIGLAVSQIDTTIDLMLASLLGARMVTIFNFAQHLQQLPIGLFGVTVAQAALPTLSATTVDEDSSVFRHAITKAMHQIMFFILPSTAMFIVLRIPLVRLVFGASRFDWDATVLTGATLAMFSLSLVAQSLVHVLARGFYALYDSRTPVIAGVAAIFTNSVASVFFIQWFHLPVWSLGLSTSIAAYVNLICLFILLTRRVPGFSLKAILMPALKMLIAAVVAGVVIFIPLKLFDQLVFDTTRTVGLLLLTGVAGSGGLVTYLFLSWVFDIGELKSYMAMLARVRRPRTVVLQPANEVVTEAQDRLTG